MNVGKADALSGPAQRHIDARPFEAPVEDEGDRAIILVHAAAGEMHGAVMDAIALAGQRQGRRRDTQVARGRGGRRGRARGWW